MRWVRPFFAAILICAINLTLLNAASADPLWQQPKLRRPVALAVSSPWLLVANERSGSISVIDVGTLSVVNEVAVGEELTDMQLVPDSNWLLATDIRKHELVLLRRNDHDLRILERTAVSSYPVSVVVSGDGHRCCVASLWSRRVTLIAIDRQAATDSTAGPRLQVIATIDLPFAPRAQWIEPSGKHLVVADAFGGRLAVIDLSSRELVALRSIDAHNIRGLATSRHGDELLVAHQMLNGQVPTVRDRITWGAVVSNVLRRIALTELFSAEASRFSEQEIAHWSMLPLGETGRAGGDPGQVLETRDGKTIVALSGVDLVTIADRPAEPLQRIAVGRRPTALALSGDQRTLYVANTLGDSLSVIDLTRGQATVAIPLGPQPELDDAQRGESLFYDARLSHDGWYSCHSCHTDGHTNGLRNDNLGDESYGAPKRILSLLGAGETGPWAWNGGQRSLDEQIRKSILVTMQGPPAGASDENVQALDAYVRTLPPPPSLAAARGDLNLATAERGRQVFARLGCADCHTPPAYTSADVYDVGLRDEVGAHEFNPPSLLGVSQRGSYFHDNRAATLREVLTRFDHGHSHELSEQELDDLLEMLRGL